MFERPKDWNVAEMQKPDVRLERETRGVRKSMVVPRHADADFVSRHYIVARQLGQGGFGSVSLITEKETGMQRVCKTVSTKGMDASILATVRREIQLLSTLDHPHVVKLYEYAEDTKKRQFALVLEYLPGGDCNALLNRVQSPSEAWLARIFHQVLLALCYCHKQGVVHRDVKPENMMLTAKPSSQNRYPSCKLIDFGMAIKRDRPLVEVCGTPSYMAPEVLQAGQEFTPKADVWSLGVSALELLAGVKPFGCPQELGSMPAVFNKIKSHGRFDDLRPRLAEAKWWASRTPAAKDFVRDIMQISLASRPTAEAALRSGWLEAHKPEASALTSEMLRSLASYASAPALAWCCLYIVAARQGVPDLDRLGEAFVAADSDGDGRLSREDLELAVDSARRWWDPSVDVEEVLATADLDHKGGLSFTQFVAACLYQRHSADGLEGLLRLAFEAIDSDRDGLVRLAEIRTLFRERDAHFLRKLPQMKPFTVEEWLHCLDDEERPAKPGVGALLGLFEDFFSALPACGPGHEPRQSTIEDIVVVRHPYRRDG